MTRSRLVTLAVACLVWTLAATPAIAQPVDPMQRYFVFKNDTPVTIYPVISAPKNANCDPGNLAVLRILHEDAHAALRHRGDAHRERRITQHVLNSGPFKERLREGGVHLLRHQRWEARFLRYFVQAEAGHPRREALAEHDKRGCVQPPLLRA